VTPDLDQPRPPNPDPPRDNGELVFAAPWESRVFGMVGAYLDRTGQPWEAFRQRLIGAIAAAPGGTPYYESFTAAFESLLVADGVLSSEAPDRLR
jgi:hypothetical protein